MGENTPTDELNVTPRAMKCLPKAGCWVHSFGAAAQSMYWRGPIGATRRLPPAGGTFEARGMEGERKRDRRLGRCKILDVALATFRGHFCRKVDFQLARKHRATHAPYRTVNLPPIAGLTAEQELLNLRMRPQT